MKSKWVGWVGLVVWVAMPLATGLAQDAAPPVATATASAPVTLSPAAADVVRLAESGVTEDVLLAFVKNSQSPYNLSADDILYLKDQGIQPEVVTAMLNHDTANPSASTAQYNYDQKLYPATTAPVPFTAPPTQPVPDTQTAPPPVDQSAPPPDTAPPPTYVSDAPPQVTYFYNDLSPYGTWVNLEGYGWCWQPRALVVNREWRPYCDGGHWDYSPAGWCWQSDYSWGWAPFHYGRWHHHDRVGWVWFPDTTWGPGWVTWRTDSDHCGWAPLPFRSDFDSRFGLRFNGVSVRADFDFGLDVGLFTFVGLRDFREHDYVHHRLEHEEVTRIYNRTTIINNYEVKNNIVINHGIPKERVEAATHTQIREVPIRNEPGPRIAGTAGSAGVIYKRELKAPTAPVRIVAQKVDQNHPVVQHAAIVPPRADLRANPTQPQNPNQSQNGVRPGGERNIQRNQNIPVQPQTPNQSQNAGRPGGEKVVPRTENNYTPGTRQSTAPVQPAPHPYANSPTRSPTYIAPGSHAVAAPTPPVQHLQQQQPVRSTVGSGYVPMNNLVQRQGGPIQVHAPETQSVSTYYPKTYHQAYGGSAAPMNSPPAGNSRIQSVAPVNAVHAAPPPQPQQPQQNQSKTPGNANGGKQNGQHN